MKSLKNHLVFGENGRSIATYYTLNLEEAKEYIDNGWSYEIDYKGKGLWLRAPDEWLVDLTDPFKIYYYGNPVVNLAYYNFLKSLARKNQLKEYVDFVISNHKIFYKNFEFAIANGPVLQSEIRILGSDMRIKNLKHDLIKSFVNGFYYNKFYSEAKDYLGRVKQIPFVYKHNEPISTNEAQFYHELNKYLKIVDEKASINNVVLKNLKKQLPDCDVIVLIPKGCFKYMSSVVDGSNIDKVMFWEMHVNSHVNKCFTLFGKDLKGKRVLIIDQIYSGKTLEIIKDLVSNQGGIPITLGVFPKSLYSLSSAEYVVFLDQVVATCDIERNQDWIIKLYKKFLNKGEKQ